MKPIRRTEWATLILILAILLGAFMRFNPTILSGFPINDGGMFAVMLDELKANHYLLPAFTTYNHLNIPFVYPPLGFYLGDLASSLFGWTAIETLRWIPAFFTTLSILAFYLLALRLLKRKYHAAVATLFFALMPRAYWWYIMGGGLTRALGQLFMLLTLASLVRLYEENRRADIFWAGLFGGLAVMSHPEAAVYTLASALFFWILLSRTRTGFINSILVALIVLVVSAPWWGTALHYHGVEPLLRGSTTGQRWVAIFNLFFFTFTEETFAALIAILGLIGIAYSLYRKQYLLPLWMVVPFLAAGRSATNPAIIPLAMLAAVGLIDVVFAAFQESRLDQSDSTTERQAPDLVPAAERNIFIFILIYLMVSAYQFDAGLSNSILYPPNREAMTWVQKNTPPASRFLVLTGDSSIFCDAVSEWFPALSGRQNLTTIQGTEWTQGPNFANHVWSTLDVQGCLANGDASCLDQAVNRSSYDYIYVSKVLRGNSNCKAGTEREFPYFLEHMKKDAGFKTVYETEDVIVFKNE
jgi:hypothetical protein